MLVFGQCLQREIVRVKEVIVASSSGCWVHAFLVLLNQSLQVWVHAPELENGLLDLCLVAREVEQSEAEVLTHLLESRNCKMLLG